jgi:flagellar protein FliL
MSTEKQKSAEKPKGKMKKLLIIGVGGLTLVGAGVGTGLYASGRMGGHEKAEDIHRPKLVARSEEPESESEGGEAKAAPPKVGTVSVKSDGMIVDPSKYEVTYFPMEQSFTANLADGGGFVQIGISLSTYYDGKVIGNIKRQMVPLRSAILMVLSEQVAPVLSTPQGKQQLRRQLTKAINEVLREKEGFGGIDSVYFTNLVIQ